MARTLLDRTLEALFADVRPREDLSEGDPLMPGRSESRTVLSRPAERAAVATSALLLTKLRERGGTRVDSEALRRATERLLAPFGEMEQARIKREVARTLLWLWEALAADDPIDEGSDGQYDPTDDDEDTQLIPDRIYPVGDKVEVINSAIADQQDLLIDYFTFYRGKLSWRRVSPRHLEHTDYLIGFCHMRREERRFRISRMRALRLVSRDEPFE